MHLFGGPGSTQRRYSARAGLVLHLLWVLAAPLTHALAERVAASERVADVEVVAAAQPHSEESCQLCRALGQPLVAGAGVAASTPAFSQLTSLLPSSDVPPRLQPASSQLARAPPLA